MKELQIIHEKMMDLRCCGNCKMYNECLFDAREKRRGHPVFAVCDYWKSDGLKYNERSIALMPPAVCKERFPRSRATCPYKPEEMEACEDYVEWAISEFSNTCMWLDRDDKKTCYDPDRRKKHFGEQTTFDF